MLWLRRFFFRNRSRAEATSDTRQGRSVEAAGVDRRDQKYPNGIELGRPHEFLADIRYSLRGLLKHPGFSAVAILSLALGIGATTSMFSLIYAVLLHPVPYADWQRLVYPTCLDADQPASGVWWFRLTWPQYQQLLKANSLQDAVADQNVSTELTGHEIPEDVTLTYITENIASFVRVPALLGRNIQPSDANVAGGEAPVVLGYDFWLRHYNGDRGVLGRSLEIDHKPYTVVGVMPKDYTWEPDMYVPMSLLPTRDRSLLAYMKLKPGVSLAEADAEIGALVQRFAKENPRDFPRHFRMHLTHITDSIITTVGHTLVLLSVAVVMLLVIGCANCSILLLARGMSRQSEFAVRAALGASRFRIVRQLLVEALVLAITGSLLGIGLAYWMAKLIFGLFPDVFLHESGIRINLPILAFSVALAVISGLIFGLLPSLRVSRPDVSQVMQSAGRKVAGPRGQTRSLNTLIAAQIALTVVLMGAAGAAIASFMRMAHRDFGYDPSHVMAVPVPLHPDSFVTQQNRAAYFEALRQKIAAVPGVLQVAISANATPPESGAGLAFEILGSPSAQRQLLRTNFISSQYFAALHIPLLQGRFWDQSEDSRGVAVAVINQALARRYFPNGNALERQIRIPELTLPKTGNEVVGVPNMNGWLQIVGVVGDSVNDGLEKPIVPALYMPYTRLMWTGTEYLVRTQGPPLAALRSVRLALQSVNPDQQAERDVDDLQGWIDRQPEFQQQRLFSILFGVFSGLALFLALIGLYSVVSYSVAQRTNEFGIRMALGAQRSHVLWIVTRNVGVTVFGGLGAGLVMFAAVRKLLIHWTENTFQSPLTLAAVIFLFILCAALACIVPALRAASVDPIRALRYE